MIFESCMGAHRMTFGSCNGFIYYDELKPIVNRVPRTHQVRQPVPEVLPNLPTHIGT